jgi:hypothetical protein
VLAVAKKGTEMTREIRSSVELQAICLSSLQACPGFEHVNEVLIQPRETTQGGANWTLAAVRPRVDNQVLRSARTTIDMLQRSYELSAAEVLAKGPRRQRA